MLRQLSAGCQAATGRILLLLTWCLLFLLFRAADNVAQQAELGQFDPASGSKAGNFDGDGEIAVRDFLAWQGGELPNLLSAEDLADWQASLGTSPELPAVQVSVPKPTTAI